MAHTVPSDESTSKASALEQANALAESGNFEGALPLFRAAFHAGAEDAAHIAESFSQCCLALDKCFAASHAACIAVELDPQWPDGFLTLARACWECGKAVSATAKSRPLGADTDAYQDSNAQQVPVGAMAWVKRSACLCELAIDHGFADMEEISEDIVASCRPLVQDVIKCEAWAVAGGDSTAEQFIGCPHAAGPGAHIWASGETLAAFLWAAWPRFIERRVLELGAGSGVVSLILAWRLREVGTESKTPKGLLSNSIEEDSGKEDIVLLSESSAFSAETAAQCVEHALKKVGWPAECADRAKRRRHSSDSVDIVATDIPGAVLEKLEENIEKWKKIDSPHCSVSAATLRWEECEADLCTHVVPKWASDDGDDLLVIGADIIYNAAQVPLLVNCLQMLFGGKAKVRARRMLLGHQARSDTLDAKMLLDLDAAGFAVGTLFDARLPFQNGSKHIKIFEIKIRSAD